MIYTNERSFSNSNTNNASRVPEYCVQHDQEYRKFVIYLDPSDNTVIAYLNYEFEEVEGGGKSIDLISTNVPHEYGGKGIAKLLANAAFDYCADNDIRMTLSCWYLDGYIKRNPIPRYKKLVNIKT